MWALFLFLNFKFASQNLPVNWTANESSLPCLRDLACQTALEGAQSNVDKFSFVKKGVESLML